MKAKIKLNLPFLNDNRKEIGKFYRLAVKNHLSKSCEIDAEWRQKLIANAQSEVNWIQLGRDKASI